MAQIEELRVAFRDDVTAGATAAERALTGMGRAGEAAAAAVEQTDQVVKRAGTSAEQLARKYIEAERATALKEAAERQHARAIADVAREEAAGALTAERAAQLRTQIAQRAEADAIRIAAAAERRMLAEQRALSGGTIGGAAAAEAQANRLRTANDNAANSGSRLGAVMGQAGFQIQDFATQVSMGQNAVTAFAVQGAQLLGIFGVGGAIAGAVLTIGSLAYNLLGARSAADELREAQERLANAMRSANDFFDTQTERAARLDRQNRATVASTLAQAAASLRAAQATRAERVAELEGTMEQVRLARGVGGDDTSLPDNIRRRAAEYDRLNGELAIAAQELQEIDNRLAQLRGGQSGNDRDEQEREARRRAEEQARLARQAADRRARELQAGDERERMRQQNMVQQETARQEREEREARERMEREERRTLEERARQNRQVTDDIVRYGADRFADLFSANGRGWQGMLDNFRQTARNLFARIAAEAVLRPVIAPIVSGLGLGSIGGLLYGSADVAAGAAGGGGLLGGAGNLLGLGSLFGGGGLTGAINSLGASSGLFGNGVTFAANSGAASYGGFGLAGEGATSGLLGSGTAMSALGGIGGGFAVGSMLGNLVAGDSRNRQTNGMIGAGAGALLGVGLAGFTGGLSLLAGGLLGGAGGGLLGGLIGPGKGFEGGDALLGINASGLVDVTGYAGKGETGQAQAAVMEQAAQQAAALNAQLSALQLRFANPTSAGGFAAALGSGQSGNPRDIAGALGAFGVNGLDLTSANDNINRAIAQARAETLQDAMGVAQWVVQTYDVLGNIAKPTSQWAAQIEAVNTSMSEAITRAREYGLATDGLAANQARAVAAINAQREASILGGLAQQSRILGGFLASRAVSSGSPQTQFGAAQQQFQSALAAARSGTAESADLGAVVQAATTLLSANSAYYASGPQAAAVENAVRSSIASLGGALDLPGFTTDLTAAIDRASDRQADSEAATRAEVVALREEMRGLRMVIERSLVG